MIELLQVVQVAQEEALLHHITSVHRHKAPSFKVKGEQREHKGPPARFTNIAEVQFDKSIVFRHVEPLLVDVNDFVVSKYCWFLSELVMEKRHA